MWQNATVTISTNGSVVPNGTQGELQVRGPSVFAGYHKNDQATLASFDGEWFRTGDLAVMDVQECVCITGRVKDVINRGGVKYNPADIEALINQLDTVEMCAIVPMPDPALGEKACCFVQLMPGIDRSQLCLDDITQHLASHNIAKYKWPERLEIIDALPLTPTRKVMKAELRALLA